LIYIDYFKINQFEKNSYYVAIDHHMYLDLY